MTKKERQDAHKWLVIKIESLCRTVANLEIQVSSMHKANELRDGEITELRASIAELRKKIRNPFDALYRIWKESEWRI